MSASRGARDRNVADGRGAGTTLPAIDPEADEAEAELEPEPEPEGPAWVCGAPGNEAWARALEGRPPRDAVVDRARTSDRI